MQNLDKSMNYSIIIEQAQGNYSAYCPDFPGTAGVGDTVEEARNSVIEAVQIQIEEMAEDNLAVPQPKAIVQYFALDAAG